MLAQSLMTFGPLEPQVPVTQAKPELVRAQPLTKAAALADSPATARIYLRAVQTRDAQFDGAVYFGVRTTKIYCKPSCPARRPRPENVLFFRRPDDAEQAGFRPCQRCRPRAANGPDRRVTLVLQACRAMQSADEEPLRLGALAARAGMSSFHFHRLFRRVTGLSPRQFAEACRVAQFKSRVRCGESVTDAIYGAGYGSSSRLYEKAAGSLGMTPAAYRRGGSGVQIHFATATCRLGRVLVAGTARGICAVCLGDSEKQVTAALREEFPAAEIVGANSRLRAWLAAVLRHLDGKMPHLDLPLDIQATAFQRKVWDELRRIPYGVTRSYRAIARRIGRPRAVRAVARACATNPVAIVIPCHRVVREDATPGGYRWGAKRKEALLQLEKSQRAKRAAQ